MIENRRLFLKRLGLGAAGIGLLVTAPGDLFAAKAAGLGLPRSTPEQEGIASAAIVGLLDAIEKSNIEFHSLMVVRHGKVVAEGWWGPYAPERKHTLYSLSKSFTSTAVGLAINEGHFTLDSKVISFFPDDLPSDVSANLAAMRVRDLLAMATGHGKDTINPMRTSTGGESWAKIFLSMPVEFEPGTHFLYNTGATYMQSAIVQKTTGKTVLEFLKPRLFEPLDIEGMDWEVDPKGIVVGGYGLRVKTEDIAKFGQLYLQKGNWNGKQLIPAEYVAMATSKQVDNAPEKPTRPNEENDWAQGYGFQFWRCTHNAVRGDGAFGQFCIMMPDQETVVAITSESFDLQGSMKLIWDNLSPALGKASLSADKTAQKELASRLKNLALKVPTSVSSTRASKISGKTFKLDENPLKVSAVTLTFAGDGGTMSVTDDKGEHKLKFGSSKWVDEKDFKTQQLFPLPGRPGLPTAVAAVGTWTDENTFQVSLRYAETAHGDNFIFAFADDGVTIKFLNSVAKGNPNSPDQRQAMSGKVVI